MTASGKKPAGRAQAASVRPEIGDFPHPGQDSLVSLAKLLMIFLVPTFSKAISTRWSLPMGVTERIIPSPEDLVLYPVPRGKER